MNIVPLYVSQCPAFELPEHNVQVINFDWVFGKVNSAFMETHLNLGLDITFDFKIKENRSLYTHSFIMTICDMITNHTKSSRVIFYSDSLTREEFREKLIKKVITVFGFDVLYGNGSLLEIMEFIQTNNCEIISKLESIIHKEKRAKSFKHIKKYLIKNGLTNLQDSFFQDISNKMLIMG